MTVKLPYMPFYGFDYETDERVRLLSDAEHGVYLRLLWHQWKEGSVPTDATRATKTIGADDTAIVTHILATFFEPNGTDGRAQNTKLHEIRRRLEAERAAKSKGGKSGRKRQLRTQLKDTLKSDASIPRGEPGQPEPEPEPEPKEKTTTNIGPSEARDVADQLFEAFWSAYPRRAGGNPEKAARLKWDARIKKGVTPEVLLAGVERYRRFCEATGKVGTEYVKQAQFWLSPSFEGWLQPWETPSEPSSLGHDDDDFFRAPS